MYQTLHPVPLSQATGKMAYTMTNDALFHIVLQNNKEVLTALIAALLHLDPVSIKNVIVQNPILQGHLIEDKRSELDILVSFNDGALINLEMQVANLKNWIPRSLYYLCREFTRLQHGDDYSQVKPAYHIGFLDYTLFPENPEFYASYRMCNLKTGNVYSDRFTLSVVELNHIDMATEEDKAYGIDKWAGLFKATTWEDINMLAKTDPIIESAAQSIYSSVTEPWVLELCQKSQEEIDGDIHRRERLAEQDKQIAEKDRQLAEQDRQLAEQDKQIADLQKQVAELSEKLSVLSNL